MDTHMSFTSAKSQKYPNFDEIFETIPNRKYIKYSRISSIWQTSLFIEVILKDTSSHRGKEFSLFLE